VLKDGATVVPETTSIIEYLARHFPGRSALIPDDAVAALDVRAQDRFYDLNVHLMMQKIIGDRIRPEGSKDPYGVAYARDKLQTALAIVDQEMSKKTWAAGDSFSMADCAAAPTLYYTNMVVMPLDADFPNAAAYLERLTKRPSYARALKEAEPYLHMVPREASKP
jgi:glutathione S-transferase